MSAPVIGQLCLIVCPLLSLTFATDAHAAFRCQEHGWGTYTDVACPGGTIVASSDLRDRATLHADLITASQRATADQMHLKELQDARQRADRLDAQQNRRARAAASNRQTKCAALALRKKWMEEDAANTSTRNAHKSKKKLHRFDERYAMECTI